MPREIRTTNVAPVRCALEWKNGEPVLVFEEFRDRRQHRVCVAIHGLEDVLGRHLHEVVKTFRGRAEYIDGVLRKG